jgi:sporulation protein YlmC with PRC-barrel domain
MNRQTSLSDFTPDVLGASSITGDEVYNSQSEHLGQIKEIMIDRRTGQVAYAVLAVGGFLGMAEKLFAIPWEALTVDDEDGYLILDVDKSVLKEAPGFDKSEWPTRPDRTLIDSIHSHFGYEPYYRRDGARSPIMRGLPRRPSDDTADVMRPPSAR